MKRTIAEVMTSHVITVTPQTPFKKMAALFTEQKVSALPVVGEDGTLAGLVRETDLLKKQELWDTGTTAVPRRHRRALAAKAAGDTAGEVMTSHVVTVPPDMAIADAARLMERRHVTCVPVVTGHGKLAGIISPRDLLKVYLRPDSRIYHEIVNDVLVRYLGTNPALVTVEVRDGLVTITGEVERKSMIPLVLPRVRAIDGVVGAEADLRFGVDDSHLSPQSNIPDC